jgi:hypothetical protein
VAARGLQRLLGLPYRDRILLVRALGWVVAARVGLRIAPLPRLQAAMVRPSRRLPGATPQQVSWAVHAISRLLPGTRCLPRSLATQALLAREGIASELKLGVARRPRGGIRAHAWIECRGHSLAGEGPGEHASFPARR